MNIDIQSDGEGGVNVTATADSLQRKVIAHTEKKANRIRDDTVSTEVSVDKRTGILTNIWLYVAMITAFLIIIVIIKNKLKNS